MDIFNFKNPGVVKAWIDTFFWYFAKVAQSMIIIGFFRYLLDLGWLTVALVVPSLLILIMLIVFLHMKYIFGAEKKFASQVNPIVMEILNNTRKLLFKKNKEK